MRLQQKSISKLTLESLLRKKRSNLQSFLKEAGIATYDRLVSRCDSIGVVPPTEAQFRETMGNPLIHEFSSPTDGIVVLNPPPSDLEDEVTDTAQDFPVQEDPPKKKKKKSNTTPQDP